MKKREGRGREDVWGNEQKNASERASKGGVTHKKLRDRKGGAGTEIAD